MNEKINFFKTLINSDKFLGINTISMVVLIGLFFFSLVFCSLLGVDALWGFSSLIVIVPLYLIFKYSKDSFILEIYIANLTLPKIKRKIAGKTVYPFKTIKKEGFYHYQ